MSKKTNWDNEPILLWDIIYYKEDDKGNQKFYSYNGDCSGFCDYVSKDELEEMPKEKVKELKSGWDFD
jgi:hypothetical protein